MNGRKQDTAGTDSLDLNIWRGLNILRYTLKGDGQLGWMFVVRRE